MIANVLRNLFSRPATRPFPATSRAPTRDARGTVVFEIEKCNFCNLCAMRCPANAIKVDRKERTLEFDLFRCVLCAACAEACRRGCVQMREPYSRPAFERPAALCLAAPAVAADDKEP